MNRFPKELEELLQLTDAMPEGMIIMQLTDALRDYVQVMDSDEKKKDKAQFVLKMTMIALLQKMNGSSVSDMKKSFEDFEKVIEILKPKAN